MPKKKTDPPGDFQKTTIKIPGTVYDKLGMALIGERKKARAEGRSAPNQLELIISALEHYLDQAPYPEVQPTRLDSIDRTLREIAAKVGASVPRATRADAKKSLRQAANAGYEPLPKS